MHTPDKIPKIIHYCWLSDDPVPASMKRYMESWKILKGYEFIKWDRERFDLSRHVWARGAFEAKKYAFAADEVRLYALYHYGGIYLDMDIEVVKRFDDLLNGNVMLATEFDGYGIEAGCMGAKKNDPFIKKCLDYYEDRPFVQGEVLPRVMRQIMEGSFPALVSQLRTKDYFTAKDYFTGLIKKTNNTYAVHNYAGSWKDSTDSDKEWVHDRWKFFAQNGDSPQNVELYKKLEDYKEAHRLHSTYESQQDEINRMRGDLIENSSSKRMLKTVAKRALTKAIGGKRTSGLLQLRTKLRNNKRTIHFVSRIDESNVGDMKASPLNYYETFFRKHFNVIKHDIYTVNLDAIEREDVVILGGGGLLYCLNEWQVTINNILNKCNNVVGWGLGFNTHYDNKSSLDEIDLSRFGLLAIRDYKHIDRVRYCPCVSALAIKNVTDRKPESKIGIIQHESFPILEEDLRVYDRMTNRSDFDSIIEFILGHEIIVTNSYHATYWAQLLKRKVVVVDPTSTKFEYFKYKPIPYSGNLKKDAAHSRVYDRALSDALLVNYEFFKQLKKYLKHLK